MSTISNNDIAKAIFLASKDKGEHERRELFSKIVKFLYRRRLISQSKDILAKLEKIINQENETLGTDLSSAHLLKEDKKKDIAKFLKQRHGVKHIIFNEVLDKTLLGGFKVEVEDEVIDLTIKNKIRKLQEYLTKSV